MSSARARCPGCGRTTLDAMAADDAGMCRCDSCGHRAYAGYVAELAALDARSRWLVDRVREGGAPPPQLTVPYGIWPVPGRAGPPPHPGAAPGPAPRQPAAGPLVMSAPGVPPRPVAGAGVQNLLLALGALLLIVAAVIFAAVVWDRIGAGGQVALMAVLTTGVGLLAVWLRPKLHGTAEALAVVTAGLLVVDALAAPLLGLVPRTWLEPPTLYPAVVAGLLAVGLIAGARRAGLRAWEWIGLAAVPSAGYLLALGTVASGSHPWVPFALVSVPVLTSIAMLALATAEQGHRVHEPVATRVAGSGGLALGALVTAAAVTVDAAIPGALLTTALAALGFGVWARRLRAGWVRLAAAALMGVGGAWVLLLPTGPSLVWPVVVAVAGLAAAALAGWLDRRAGPAGPVGLMGVGRAPTVRWALVPGAAACALWLWWAVGVVALARGPAQQQDRQLAVLAAIVAAVGFAVARWLPAAPWPAAVLGQLSLLLGLPERPGPIELVTLPFAALLLLAGALWRQHRGAPAGTTEPSSLVWLGPAVTVALVPSALATWGAPWVSPAPTESPTEALVRLGVVLVACVAALAAGARWGLAGLLVPAAAALVIATLAQVWAGLAALPRWVAFGLAGTLLVLLGARIEWLRGQRGRVGAWLRELR